MTTRVQRIENLSASTVQLLVRHTQLEPGMMTHWDVVLGPGQSVTYESILGDKLPIPEAASASAFERSRIIVRVGATFYAIYRHDGRTRLVHGQAYGSPTDQLGPWPYDGAIALVIDPRGLPTAIRL